MRYGERSGRGALATVFLLNGLGIVDQTRAAHELAAHGAPAAAFWASPGPEVQAQLVNFLKNLAMLGGLCFVAFRTAPAARSHPALEHHQEVA